MAKSYWFKDWPTGNGQRGNFSNNKQDTFKPEDGFLGVRLQQGVPLLDRDWNELEDIRRYQEVMLRRHYLGDGSPDDGFRISALDPPTNDFMISKGRMLVNGFEAVNEPAGSDFILYSSQAGAPPLKKVTAIPPLKATREDIVYLDLWIEEVTGADLPRLNNPDDVAMETCIRHRLRWAVRVDEGHKGHDPVVGHHFLDLARIIRTSARDTIGSADVTDLRSSWQSPYSAQSRLRNAINSLISGNMPSDPTMDLATFSSSDYPLTLTKDDMGNMIIFWWQDNNIWAKRYSASSRNWGAAVQITSGTAVKSYYYSFADSRGDIWVFWIQKDSSTNIYNVWTKRFNTAKGVWTGDVQLTSGAGNEYFREAFEDRNGNVWLFWQQQEGTGNTYNYWAKRYAQGSWGANTQLTSGTTDKYYNRLFVGSNGSIWFFWSQKEVNSSVYNLFAKSFDGSSWSSDFTLTSGTANKGYANSFEDRNGVIWLFWQQVDGSVYNTYYRRFASGSWSGAAALTSGTQAKYYFNSLMDARGDIWLFWQQMDSAYNFWAKRFTANAWSNDMQLTSGDTGKSVNTPVAGKKRDVFFLYSLADANNVYNIYAQRFNFDSNAWEYAQITSGTTNKFIQNMTTFSNGDLVLFWQQDNIYMSSIFNGLELYWSGATQAVSGVNVWIYRVLERSNGEIWLLIYGYPYYNLWCSKFIDGDWVSEGERLISGATQKQIIDVFEGATGEVWAFWMTYSNNQSISRKIKARRIYGSI
jgi:hypothetical protein